jgi:hypothetical protein
VWLHACPLEAAVPCRDRVYQKLADTADATLRVLEHDAVGGIVVQGYLLPDLLVVVQDIDPVEQWNCSGCLWEHASDIASADTTSQPVV